MVWRGSVVRAFDKSVADVGYANGQSLPLLTCSGIFFQCHSFLEIFWCCIYIVGHKHVKGVGMHSPPFKLLSCDLGNPLLIVQTSKGKLPLFSHSLWFFIGFSMFRCITTIIINVRSFVLFCCSVTSRC